MIHPFKHPFTGLLAGAAIAAAVAGCTGSDGDPSTTTTTSGTGGHGTTASTTTTSGTGGGPVAESHGPVTQGISGGGVGKSATYKMVFAIGQPATHGKATSASYQMQSASGNSGSEKQ